MSDRANVLTTIIGAVTAVLGLVTAVLVLAATMGTNSQQPVSTPPGGTLVAATGAPTPLPTVEPTGSASPSADPSPTAEPTAEPSAAPSQSLIPPPSAPPTASPAPTASPTPTPRPTATPEPTPPPTPEPTPRPIIFYSVRDDPVTRSANADLYAVDPETAIERRLTENPEPDSDPVWSPDGTRIAFDSRREGGTRDIWVLEPDGTFTRITDDDTDDAFPTWSPDGTRLAWSRGTGSDREIWVASAADGSDAHDVTSGSDDRFPAWSSSGLLAFQRRAGSAWEIWVLEPDVSGPVVRIGLGDGGGSHPAWSPDGRRIAFVRPVDGVNRVFTAAANGVSSVREVTGDVECDCEFPSWSPDGTEIAFVGPRGDIRPLIVVPAQGGPGRRLTTNGLVPSWWD